MIRFFSEANPISILLLFLLGVVIRIPYFLDPAVPDLDPNAGYLYVLIHHHLSATFKFIPYLSPLLAYVLIFIQGLSINGFMNGQKLLGTPQLLFAFSYIIFSSLMPQWNILSAPLLVNGIMTIILPKTVSLYQHKNIQGELFTISILIGISTLLYKPAIIFILLLYFFLIILRSFQLSEWVLLLIGLCLPYYLMLVYDYVWDHWDQAVYLKPIVNWGLPGFKREPADIISISLAAIPSTIGFFMLRKYASRLLTVQRKIWVVISIYIIITLGYVFVTQDQNYSGLILFIYPASFCLAGFFHLSAVKFFPYVYPWLVFGFLAVRNFL